MRVTAYVWLFCGLLAGCGGGGGGTFQLTVVLPQGDDGLKEQIGWLQVWAIPIQAIPIQPLGETNVTCEMLLGDLSGKPPIDMPDERLKGTVYWVYEVPASGTIGQVDGVLELTGDGEWLFYAHCRRKMGGVFLRACQRSVAGEADIVLTLRQ